MEGGEEGGANEFHLTEKVIRGHSGPKNLKDFIEAIRTKFAKGSILLERRVHPKMKGRKRPGLRVIRPGIVFLSRSAKTKGEGLNGEAGGFRKRRGKGRREGKQKNSIREEPRKGREENDKTIVDFVCEDNGTRRQSKREGGNGPMILREMSGGSSRTREKEKQAARQRGKGGGEKKWILSRHTGK